MARQEADESRNSWLCYTLSSWEQEMSKKCLARDRKKPSEKLAEYFEAQREDLYRKLTQSYYIYVPNLGWFVNNMCIWIGTYYYTSSCVYVAMQGINPALSLCLIILHVGLFIKECIQIY